MRGEFPQTCNNFLIHQIMPPNHQWDIFTEHTPSYVIKVAFWNFWGSTRERERRRKYPLTLSPSLPLSLPLSPSLSLCLTNGHFLIFSMHNIQTSSYYRLKNLIKIIKNSSRSANWSADQIMSLVDRVASNYILLFDDFKEQAGHEKVEKQWHRVS